jgi:hypothetical protein
MIALQTEFSLSVAVCAWCRPHEHGYGLRATTHGICPSHLHQVLRELEGRDLDFAPDSSSAIPSDDELWRELLLPL